jgi:RNA polymerase sigma-70 factor (sigma-E family)
VAEDDALDRFARAHAKGLLRFAVLMASAGEDAEDLVQECLIRLAPRLDRLTDPEAVAYGRRVITNLSVDQHRRRSRSSALSRLLSRPSPQLNVEQQVTDRDAVIALLASLPTRQRAAVVLRYWAGLSEREIADTLRCSQGTVKSQISRALASLRERVEHTDVVGDSHV